MTQTESQRFLEDLKENFKELYYGFSSNDAGQVHKSNVPILFMPLKGKSHEAYNTKILTRQHTQ